MRPRRYTAALMAEAGGPAARVDTIEKSSIHATLATGEICKAGLGDRVRILRGQATEILQDLSEPYDVNLPWTPIGRTTRIGCLTLLA